MFRVCRAVAGAGRAAMPAMRPAASTASPAVARGIGGVADPLGPMAMARAFSAMSARSPAPAVGPTVGGARGMSTHYVKVFYGDVDTVRSPFSLPHSFRRGSL